MTRFVLPATDVQVGDRLDIMGRTRVARILVRNGRVLAQTKTRGARSPSVRAWNAGDSATVWR